MNTFEDKVRRTVEQIKHESYHAIAADITQRRMAWLDRNLPEKEVYTPFTPRDVFELLFFEQMQLERSDLAVVSETDDEIVWLSHNPCTLLEACISLGLDTRRVCRPVNEKATQAFVSRINPQLRFQRSYEEIRPHAEYCRERIIRIDFDAYMRTAIREAHIAKSEGNEAYGAVVVFEDQVIGQAHNTVITGHDPSCHAEMNALRQAVKTLSDRDLCGAILFTTCEPCAMCTAFAIYANITTIVYGISIAEMTGLDKASINLSAKHIIEQSSCEIEIIANILHDECKALYV
ncbi:MAG: nucleoside deaminase [Anaerolineaceae bacterium]|nr:nucleoside deaminase [Anaerolineaceae bacterium]